MAYLITFACYGCHMHGDALGSVDRKHNLPGGRFVDASPKRLSAEKLQMDQRPYIMDERRREAVLAAMVDRSQDRGWSLLAAHVRTNHVHVVIVAEALPERVMNDLKSFASRRLNQLEFDDAIESGGHGMGVRDGCGIERRYPLQSNMSLINRERRWRFIRHDRSLWSRLVGPNEP